MNLSDFDYDLPPAQIATHPAARRDASRLMRVPRDGAPRSHHAFHDLPGMLRSGDCLVLNESRVIPARLHLARLTGGMSEILLLAPVQPAAASPAAPSNEIVWEAMVRPARKLPPGTKLELPDALGQAVILEGQGRTRRIRFDFKMAAAPPGATQYPPADLEEAYGSHKTHKTYSSDRPDTDPPEFLAFLARYGQMPLPPYILHQRRERGESTDAPAEDRERYQTVYAQREGSIAAPTAGLHFTPELLAAISARGIEIRRVTLHVGAGTFEPIEVDDFEKHVMHREMYEVDEPNARAIESARTDPQRRIVAVGTTTVRTLESCMARHDAVVATRESTNLFIHPGYRFRAVDAMITNFHLPKSTLLLLVAAFAASPAHPDSGRETILSAYREAVAQSYRFFSYGDAMLIE